MIRLTNKASRALGLAAAESVVLPAGGSAEVSEQHFARLRANPRTAKWIDAGLIEVVETGTGGATEGTRIYEEAVSADSGTKRPGRGSQGLTHDIELVHKGGGYWSVVVNGIEVTDRGVRKERAEEIAAEYQ